MAKHKYDLILLSGFLAVTAAAVIVLLLSRNTGAFAVVTVKNKEVARYPLSVNREVKIGDSKHSNTLTIKDGCAYISNATCPDKLCQKQGKIKYSGQSIICLPNKTVIEIVSAENGDTDF